MRSKIAKKILNETPQETKDKVNEYANKLVLSGVSDRKPHHNDWGEAWVMCRDCNAKLYSTDGTQDYAVGCPTKEECEEDNSYYR